jgi:16S rRNA (cytosine967-C5)-methyltransferase
VGVSLVKRRRPREDSTDAPGMAARLLAAEIIEGVLRRRRPLDDELNGERAQTALAALDERDRAFARALIATALRNLGSLRHLIGLFAERGLPRDAPRVETILLLGAAQILFLNVPDHAAVDLGVRMARADRQALHYAPLVNALLRRVTREGKERLAERDIAVLNTPDWLLARWTATYGTETAHAIAVAHSTEPALDLTVPSNPEHWAAQLGGHVLPTGSVRTIAHGPVTALPGFAEGAWWVQDAAAALPARLLGNLAGLRVADLCAAPGGKAAQLAAAGAQLTAVDRAPRRVTQLRENLARLQLTADIVCANAEQWEAAPFDAVLLDAPCSATGTIRRHPDVQWLKSETDIGKLAAFQRRLLARASALTKPGGTLVYCTCSLEPEEGEQAVAELLAHDSSLRRAPITAAEVFGQTEFLTEDGDLRTLPCHWPATPLRLAGLDGFYAARLVKH